MPSFADVRNAISEWVSNNVLPQHPVPQSAFETRVTRTPGFVVPTGNGGGGFTASQNPVETLQGSALDPTIKAALVKAWAPKGNGVVSLDPSVAGGPQQSRILRHEQLHQVFNAGNLGENVQQILPYIDRGYGKYLEESPTYQSEIKNFGLPNVIADEGSAMDLTSGKPSAALQSFLVNLLQSKGKSLQAKQIQELAK